jgi:hypothetical protein
MAKMAMARLWLRFYVSAVSHSLSLSTHTRGMLDLRPLFRDDSASTHGRNLPEADHEAVQVDR